MTENLQKDIKDNTELTENYLKQINKSFYSMLKNPTEKEIEKHRKLRDAVIALWLASLFNKIEIILYTSAQRGIDEADKQLKQRNKTDVKGKKITVDTFENQVKQRKQSNEEDIILVSQSIKVNSEKVIKQLVNTSAFFDISHQKKLSSELTAELLEKGISFFYDRAGRKYSIAEYINMKIMTEAINAERLSFFTRAVQYGVDLVKIVHLNLHPACELCMPFENKILSITGNTNGYMTIEEAAMQGLFHPRCDHIPAHFELNPTDNGNDGKIELNEANKKRFEYNKKRNFLFI